MEWLNQNLDAYRIIAEILHDLRSTLRRHLEAAHGKSWYRKGVPRDVMDRLILSKEREQAIDWYDSEYQEIIDYALFSDLIEIIEHDGSSFSQLTRLAPTQALLHSRFLELEVMRSKIGRARPISDSELAFLTTVHLRFRKALEEIASGVGAKPAEGEAEAADRASEPAAGADATTPAKLEAETVEVAEPVPGDAVPAPPASSKTPPARAPMRAATRTGRPQAGASVDTVPEAPGASQSITKALADGDDRAILRELYREVTAIAEGIWATDSPPAPQVWPKVSTSGWYESNISALGLKPLSDFYETISNVQEKLRDDSSKEQLQDFLKESNFAKILLALRDMFQRNKI